jgi:hypothetical protein
MALRNNALFSRKQPGGVFNLVNIENYPGSVFFVNSVTGSDAAGYGYNPDTPVATIDYAVGLCTDSVGDVIYVLPGHNESLTGATSCVIDKIGVSVIGLGRGWNRPTLDYDHTAATVEVDARNVRLSNLIFVAATASTVLGVNVDGHDCEIDNCLFTFSETGDEFVTSISVATFDRCHIHDNVFETEEAAGASAQCITVDDTEDTIIQRNIFRGTWTASVILAATVLSKRLMILDNVIYNSDTSVYNAIDMATLSTTGIVARNVITTLYGGAGTMAKLIRIGFLTWHQNTFANAVSERAVGQLDTTGIPATSST